VSGVEALLRWQHPERGLIAPANFITFAEDSGLIVPLGEWVLRAACEQLKAWRNSGLAGLRMAVNLSPRQFRQPDLTRRIASILRDAGLSGELLELEITEGSVMQDPEASVRMLQELKDMKITISIDDFGIGYSSLHYLKRFPIDCLKIDQAFVRDIHRNPADVAIVRAIIALAKGLNLAVIAEGVETAEQGTMLRLFGCEEAQGFFFSRPRPAAEIEELVRKGRLAA
jgi:EAL domain-containing protein (putative c-di-GMP-specific phosphodiesterase class I)